LCRNCIINYTKAIELKPDYADAYNNRGNAYAAKGQHEQASADYTKAIELQPDYASVYNNRGNAYSGKMKYDQAIYNLKKDMVFKQT